MANQEEFWREYCIVEIDSANNPFPIELDLMTDAEDLDVNEVEDEEEEKS